MDVEEALSCFVTGCVVRVVGHIEVVLAYCSPSSSTEMYRELLWILFDDVGNAET